MEMHKSATVSAMGKHTELPFSNLADGCVGVLPVFTTREQAETHAVNPTSVLEINFNNQNKEE